MPGGWALTYPLLPVNGSKHLRHPGRPESGEREHPRGRPVSAAHCAWHPAAQSDPSGTARQREPKEQRTAEGTLLRRPSQWWVKPPPGGGAGKARLTSLVARRRGLGSKSGDCDSILARVTLCSQESGSSDVPDQDYVTTPTCGVRLVTLQNAPVAVVSLNVRETKVEVWVT
jgi:hypothetical protein